MIAFQNVFRTRAMDGNVECRESRWLWWKAEIKAFLLQIGCKNYVLPQQIQARLVIDLLYGKS